MIEKTKRETETVAVSMNPYSVALRTLWFSMGCLGNFEEGEVFWREGLRTAYEIGDLVVLAVQNFTTANFGSSEGTGTLQGSILRRVSNILEEANWIVMLVLLGPS